MANVVVLMSGGRVPGPDRPLPDTAQLLRLWR